MHAVISGLDFDLSIRICKSPCIARRDLMYVPRPLIMSSESVRKWNVLVQDTSLSVYSGNACSFFKLLVLCIVLARRMARGDGLALSALLLLTIALWKGGAWMGPLAASPRRDVRVALVPRRPSCPWPCRSRVVRWKALEDRDGTSPSASALKVGPGAIDQGVLGE